MLGTMQEGIYYDAKSPIGSSFCILSLTGDRSQITDVGFGLGRIWKTLNNLKSGILSDLNIDSRHRKSGNLSVLVGYGPNAFDIPGSEKRKPSGFNNDTNFKRPLPTGGGRIFDKSNLRYSTKVIDNHLLRDHIVFQFIADNEFYTNRAVVEVWKELNRLEQHLGSLPLHITGIYTGFQRPDHRNWLGFHDGVSNLKKNERQLVIPIGPRFSNSQDKWTQNGTYLAFIRIAINLQKWIEIGTQEQEIIIGRDKITGCPLIKVDRKGKPVKDIRCPIRGTSEVIDRGNERFRNHPNYGIATGSKVLQYSHIADTNPSNQLTVGDKRSLRIFRQGFEFLVSTNENPGFVTGLNFVSFQNSPERLVRALTYHPPSLNKSATGDSVNSLNQFMSVLQAGIFFVPPVTKHEPFPGAEIFISPRKLKKFTTELT